MILNLYPSVIEAYIHPEDQCELEFAELAELFQDSSQLLPRKEAGKLFNCCRYRADSENPSWISERETRPREQFIRRCRANVESIDCLLLDIDGTMSLESAVDQWAEWEFLIYSTFGNRLDKPKFRLVIPLQESLTRQEFDARHPAMCEQFSVDGASFTISQAFYLPSYSQENQSIAFVHWNQCSQRYSALTLPAEDLLDSRPTVDLQALVRTDIATSIRRTLLTGRDLHYNDALTLGVVCKSNGITAEEYREIIQAIAHPDSVLRSRQVDLQDLYRESYATHVTHRKIEQLMRRLNCDMWRWSATKI